MISGNSSAEYKNTLAIKEEVKIVNFNCYQSNRE